MAEALSDDARLTSVCRVGPTSGLSREQRHRKTKIGTEVAHVTRDSDTTFKVKRSTCTGWGHIVAASHTACSNSKNCCIVNSILGGVWYCKYVVILYPQATTYVVAVARMHIVNFTTNLLMPIYGLTETGQIQRQMRGGACL